MNKYAKSSFDLLSNIRFFSLATHHPDSGSPWSASLLYVPRYDPLRLIWYSKLITRHSHEISINPLVSGSLYHNRVNPDTSLDLAGAQFIGQAHEIPDNELQETYDYYFNFLFPDENIRKKKARPLSEFHGHGRRRFYELDVQEWWVYDSELWHNQQDDGRVFVPLSELTHPPENQ
ncbi:hypothetical protein XBJ2_60017 [Xenorhabdus bovienii str. Jollieti]|uniref:Pyridoxamine 5'-phosphate oxidase N-terminal domain-containing protein n=1 Tax=Xenorhabdus bovienii (strain SS-2004) TaxID=406818 RepID=D3UYD9_XENBS|nr:pyridoxamine 5'-phosphate oxidase family protein [Xenorhabdus bovienii]CBJ79317.1 hypothetical protein XBJ1_0166 [Xenorhabdus bovienii SS-2004]CDH30161.1 hypothetical protein XBJ2_60017 [Xenorhabdus bovienii str. Jollieti]